MAQNLTNVHKKEEETESYDTETRAGALLLDKHEPGWRSKVKRANIDARRGCLISQLRSSYDQGITSLFLAEYGREPSEVEAQAFSLAHGFVARFDGQATPEQNRLEVQNLEQAWEAVLAQT